MKVVALLNARVKCPGCGQLGYWRAAARVHVRANSRIHKSECMRCGEQVAVKVERSKTAGCGDEPVRREYEALRRLQTVFPQDRFYGTLAPVDYLEDGGHGVMITRWFDGVDLARYARGLADTDYADAFRAAGEWLRRLHGSDRAPGPGRPLDVADKLESLRQTGGPALNGSATVKMAYAWLEKRGQQVARLNVPVARIHGDFKPQNVLCDGRSYLGVDTHWAYIAPVVYDLAPFLDHAWLTTNGILGLRTHRRYELAEESFLNGYGYTGDPAPLRWAQLYFAVHYWIDWRQAGGLTAFPTTLKVRSLLLKLTTTNVARPRDA